MTTIPLPDTLAGWLERVERAHPKSIDLTLERVLRVSERLDLRFSAPVVTVAGTNGKGSTCAFIDSIAREAGMRVGLYSKPHLVHFEERCRIDGRMVSAKALLPHFEAVELARGHISLTYFEHTTLAILRLLSESELDLVVLEVGLGGRCDAVNVVDADCAVITGIDIDHTDYLGPDREAIGREKAGIFRPGRPAVVGDLSPPVSLLAHAEVLGTPLRLAGRDFRVGRRRALHWDWEGWAGGREQLPVPALHGAFQLQNAATAIAALECLPPVPDDAAVASGLCNVQLPGRFQVLPGTPEVIIDVAHNRQSVAALAATLSARQCSGRTVAVFGCMQDKEIGSILDAMGELIDHWFVADLPLGRAARAEDLRRSLEERRRKVTACASLGDALMAARSACSSSDRIVAFGSFHVVGPMLGAPSALDA